MMNKSLALVVLSTAALSTTVEGFSTAASSSLPTSRTSSTAVNAYVPAGFTPESWKKFQEKEKARQKQQGLGRMGPKGFESRSMQSFQEALERGEASHLMPMFNAKEKLASGKIRKEDIPYSKFGYVVETATNSSAKTRREEQFD